MLTKKNLFQDAGLPAFISKRSGAPGKSQPIVVRQQGDEFVAIIQRDGGDPDTHHWVLVEKADLPKLARRLDPGHKRDAKAVRKVVEALKNIDNGCTPNDVTLAWCINVLNNLGE
jgi:hypothetical protein